MMNSPEQSGSDSWTIDRGNTFETQDAPSEALDKRAEQAREYVVHYLPDASPDLEDAALTLVDAVRSDLENEQYWKVGLAERLQLKSDDVDRLAAFVAQLKADRGWLDDVSRESVTQPEAAGSVAQSEASKLFADKADAREAFLATAEAMSNELDALEPNEEDPLGMLDELMSVLKRYAVEMELPDGRTVRGLPLTLADSGVPESQWDEWGGGDRLSTGALPSLRVELERAIRSREGFSARAALSSYYPAAVERTIDRLFAQNP